MEKEGLNMLKKFYEFLNEGVDNTDIMDQINDRIEGEILPLLNNTYNVKYDKGKMISVKSNKEKFSFKIFIENDKISVEIIPFTPPIYELSYDIEYENINNIIKLITNEIISGGDEEKTEDVQDEIQKEIPTPKRNNKKRNNNSIDIDIVQEVLEEAFVNNEIILKKVDINELLLRMMKKS